MKLKLQDGFSAVELLITLFIASIFLIAGYQIWVFVQLSGSASIQFAKASDLAYDYMRRYTINTPVCTSSAPTINPQPTVDGLHNVNLTIAYSCPPNTANITKVTATVTYGPNPQKSVVHAVYAQSK